MACDRRSTADAPAAPLWDDGRLQDPHGQPDKARRVRQMFDGIAPTYRLVNSVASAGIDRRWRRATVRLAEVRPTDRVLDVACGTGDLAEAFARARPHQVVGVDFARHMLSQTGRSGACGTAWVQGDALCLPFADRSFDIVSCAFGVRNFQDLERGLSEMYRMLRSGGRAMILEFNEPRGRVLRRLYRLYLTRIMPGLATWISGDTSGAYRYLPSSVLSFVSPERLQGLLTAVGFAATAIQPRTFGIVTIYRADKT